MSRAAFQILALPYRFIGNGIAFAVFRRADDKSWQGIAGGGEAGERPVDAARREVEEESGLSNVALLALDSMAMIPRVHFCPAIPWDPDILVVPEFSFGVDAGDQDIGLSHEHVEVKWLAFDAAMAMLRWDSNKTALWELNERLKKANAGRDAAAGSGPAHASTAFWARFVPSVRSRE